MEDRLKCYSVTILEDRYGGAYSGGQWIAIANSDIHKIKYVDYEANGDDGSSIDFWDDAPDYVAVGDTPNQALNNLYNR